MDGWLDAWLDGQIHRMLVDILMRGLVDDGRMHSLLGDSQMDAWNDGRTGWRTDGAQSSLQLSEAKLR